MDHFPIHDYADWKERQRSFEDLGAFYAGTVNGARPWDPATYALVFAVLGLTGLAASAIPAARATRVHPIEALRYE